MTKHLQTSIINEVKNCADTDLLDLIYKLLLIERKEGKR